ncbi:MAG: YdiU family protein [Pseudohongiella sp.]|nr:YdiU family protein [Pseudohongiella sp.]
MSLTTETQQFVNRFTRELPADPITENFSRQVQHSAYSRVQPEKVSSPALVGVNQALAISLGFGKFLEDPARLALILSGNELLEGMSPYAMAYGGHQFGSWAGQLGDGRAINLGELRDSEGRFQTLQLKGAGPTPYSRHADGRAVLRSSLREYLCSEAMFALGVPTTRALSLVTSGDKVVRDMFYDGNPQAEPGAIVCRVSPSFVRFGSFELPAARGDVELLQKLVRFVIRSDWPDLASRLAAANSDAKTKQVYLDWFSRICALSQEMVIHWMRVGFVHGVMNTDNMSVLGLTIDYGPYGWVDDYDPDWTPNTTDAGQRRYRFGQQPAIVRWNLYQLANAIYPLVQDAEALQSILQTLPETYERSYHRMMCSKLGIDDTLPLSAELIRVLPTVLTSQPTDMTLFFRSLANFDVNTDAALSDCVASAFYGDQGLLEANYELYRMWEEKYRLCLRNSSGGQLRIQIMNEVNPRYVPRNYLAQQAIEAMENGDPEVFSSLLTVLSKPYDEQPENLQRFGQKRPDWASNKPGCSMLSCSS